MNREKEPFILRDKRSNIPQLTAMTVCYLITLMFRGEAHQSPLAVSTSEQPTL